MNLDDVEETPEKPVFTCGICNNEIKEGDEYFEYTRHGGFELSKGVGYLKSEKPEWVRIGEFWNYAHLSHFINPTSL